MSGLKAFHLAAFFSVLVSGLAFLAMLLYLTADIQWQRACLKVVRRLLKTVAIRQVMGILAAMTFVRFGLEPLVKVLRRLFRAQGVWEKSSEFYILREVRPQSSWGQGAPWSDQRVTLLKVCFCVLAMPAGLCTACVQLPVVYATRLQPLVAERAASVVLAGATALLGKL